MCTVALMFGVLAITSPIWIMIGFGVVGFIREQFFSCN